MTNSAATATLPDVDVIVPTRDRPELLRRTLAGVLDQTYAGQVHALVVFDGDEPDRSLERDWHHRRVTVLRNTRSPGLAGGRNSGLLAATAPLVAFCDDDDVWLPHKLSQQVRLLEEFPQAALTSCAIRVRYGDTVSERRLDLPTVGLHDLLASRLMELHPSTFLMRRDAVVNGFGLVAEDIPASYAEDYEFLLRAATYGEIASSPAVGAEILWHPQSFFDARWPTIADALTWLLERYPEFRQVPKGYARVAGQIAFAHAASREPGAGLTWALRAARANPREPRALLAAAVAMRLVTPRVVLAALHRHGRGI